MGHKQTTNEKNGVAVHEAEQYLRNPDNPKTLRVQYLGSSRTLRIINKCDIYIHAPRKSKRGWVFNDWANITKISYPKTLTAEEFNEKLVKKYIREAKKATFTNPFIRKCLEADITKDAYKNGITTGNRIDGQKISIKTLLDHAPSETNEFLNAFRNKQRYSSGRFSFQGYECTLSTGVYNKDNSYLQPEDVCGYLSKEYKDCGNGYYYILINEDAFIGYDVD